MHLAECSVSSLVKFGFNSYEFFDLKNDPYEMNNLIDSPEHQEIIQQLVNLVSEHRWHKNST